MFYPLHENFLGTWEELCERASFEHIDFICGDHPLGNFAYSPFTFDEGIEYCCMVQCYNKKKADYFGDKETGQKIMASNSAQEMVKLGLEVEGAHNWDHSDYQSWQKDRRPLMKRIIQAKLMQHPEIKQKLLATEDSVIVDCCKENSQYWSINIKDPFMPRTAWMVWMSNWQGSNMIGKILMELRDGTLKVD